jgi:hypothetical protein
MNTSFVKSAPDGDFAEVTALIKGWEVQLHGLVNQKRAIWFDMYPMQGIPDEIKNTLSQQGYHDHILEIDRWQHFLVPFEIDSLSPE